MHRWPIQWPKKNIARCCGRRSRLVQNYSTSVQTQKVDNHHHHHQQRTHPSSVLNTTASSSRTDPFDLLTPELALLRSSLLNLLGSTHPGLTELAKKCYFIHPSQQLRPLVALLFSQATNGLGKEWEKRKWYAEFEEMEGPLDDNGPLTRAGTLLEENPNMPDDAASFEGVFKLPIPLPALSYPPPIDDYEPEEGGLLPTQLRLAQIMEMIHIASMLHNEIVDTIVSNPFLPNKLAVLGGDFLLGRASCALSRLGQSEVVELVASVISNIVEGRVMRKDIVRMPLPDAWDHYMHQTYLTTASLLAKGTRAAVVLGGSLEGEVWNDLAYFYGRHLGTAFQLVEETIDYKTGLSKVESVTAPILYAWEEHPDLGDVIHRGFSKSGDVDMARECIQKSSALERTLELARLHAEEARNMVKQLPESDQRHALDVLCERVVQRTW